MTMGQSMKNARKKAGLTQKKLSEISGIPLTSIAKYEGDEVSPTITKVHILANALGISIDEYIGRESSRSAKEIQFSTRLKVLKEVEDKFIEFLQQMAGDTKC